MAATFSWQIRNGASGTATDLGSTGNLQNFSSVDLPGTSHYAANPITAGQNSMELWFRLKYSGSFNRISDLRFWQSVAFSPATGLQVMFKGDQQIYLQPAAGTSSIATSSIPTTDPGTANVTIGGNLSGSLTTSGTSDHIVLQLRTTTAAAAGDTSLATFTSSYSENRCKRIQQLSPASRNRLHRFNAVNQTDYEIRDVLRQF